MLILPLGYTVHEVFAAGGNPYGASFVSDHSVAGPDAAARRTPPATRERTARPLRRRTRATQPRPGTFAVKRPSPQSFRGAALT